MESHDSINVGFVMIGTYFCPLLMTFWNILESSYRVKSKLFMSPLSLHILILFLYMTQAHLLQQESEESVV